MQFPIYAYNMRPIDDDSPIHMAEEQHDSSAHDAAAEPGSPLNEAGAVSPRLSSTSPIEEEALMEVRGLGAAAKAQGDPPDCEG